MVRPPSHIFIVRHGSRLDSADKDWHLTSATPYDTPLTYGGFLQARQVGNQISTLLAQAKVDAEVSRNGEVISGRRRRFRIVIHSSPYLRCLQTSIGISSGLSQTPLGSIYQPSDLIVPRGAPDSPPSQFKSTLVRVDAFLGEWLAPEYFERITPPPDAALMVAGAKAELLRREDYSMYTTPVHISTHRPRASTSSLWNGSQSTPFPDLAGLPPPVSEYDRDASDAPSATAPVHIAPRQKTGYVAPQPPFAVSSRGKVPDGLVAHARDACTLVDFPWDSMNAPLNFGDGGVLADEWATMHKRFRSGLKKMVNWYATTARPDELQPLRSSEPGDAETEGAQEPDEESAPGNDDDNIETVVILVSHGAGCNALMGAVTDQPVLCDVGIASISMAVRKESLDYSQAFLQTRPQDPAPLRLVPVDQVYDLKVQVSTDHLRPGTSASISSPDSARPPSASSSTWGSFNHTGRRGRTGTESSATMGGPVLNPFAHRDSVSSVGGRDSFAIHTAGISSRRQSFVSRTSQASGAAISGQASSSGNEAWSNGTPPSGLWSPVSSSLFFMDDDDTDGPVDDLDSLVPDFDKKLLDSSWSSCVREDMTATATATATLATTRTTMTPSPTTTTTTTMKAATGGAVPIATIQARKKATEEGMSLPDFDLAVRPPSIRSPASSGPPDRPVFSTSIKIKKSVGAQKLSDEVGYGGFGDPFGGGWGFRSVPTSESAPPPQWSWPASGRF